MKKAMIVILTFALFLTFTLTGCNNKSFANTDNALYLYADCAVEDSLIRDFDTNKYDINEVKALMQEELNEFNSQNEGLVADSSLHETQEPQIEKAISIVELSAEKKQYRQRLIYSNAGNYCDYNADTISDRNGTVLKTGYLDQADADLFSLSFVTTDKKQFNLETVANTGNGKQYRYILCDFETVLFGSGKIAAYSTTGKYVKNNNSVETGGGKKVAVIFED